MDDAHKGHRQRLRKRFLNTGLDSFEDHELLELLLFYCIPRKDTNQIAHELINYFGSLSNLFEADAKTLCENCKVSEQTAVLLTMVPALARRYFSGKWEKKVSLETSSIVGEYAISLLTGRTNECFYLLCLDNKRSLNHAAFLSEGTIDETQIHTRTVVEAAIRHKAVTVVLVHNHPSGLLGASRSDIEATKRIIAALESIEIQVLDHIIVAGDKYFSFAEKKLLHF